MLLRSRWKYSIECEPILLRSCQLLGGPHHYRTEVLIERDHDLTVLPFLNRIGRTETVQGVQGSGLICTTL